MAWKIVWPWATRSWFKWAMWGVKKVAKPMVKPVAKPMTSPIAKPTISNTVNTKPIQVKKPVKKF